MSDDANAGQRAVKATQSHNQAKIIKKIGDFILASLSVANPEWARGRV